MADKPKAALQVIYAASQYIAPGTGPKISLTKEIITGMALGLVGGVAWKVCVTKSCQSTKKKKKRKDTLFQSPKYFCFIGSHNGLLSECTDQTFHNNVNTIVRVCVLLGLSFQRKEK